ncbi:MAG: hypothetical protein IKJ43_01395 [Bacilli bacterium]|nr:hypothetical protein [Bacilli bacterium]
MKITVKSNGEYNTRVGINVNVIESSMKKLLKKKPHLCASCGSVACGENRSLQNVIVKTGIRTLDRDYIFECSGYEKRDEFTPSVQEQGTDKVDSRVYRIAHPTVRRAIDHIK